MVDDSTRQQAAAGRPARVFLDVPFADKDVAKASGAVGPGGEALQQDWMR